MRVIAGSVYERNSCNMLAVIVYLQLFKALEF